VSEVVLADPAGDTAGLFEYSGERVPKPSGGGAHPDVVRAERPRLTPFGRGEMDGIQRTKRHGGMTDIEDGSGSFDEVRGHRDQIEARRAHVSNHLPPGAPAMRPVDRPLALLANQSRKTLDEHKL
jgi:hypothetical protein